MIETMVCTVERIIVNKKDGWDITFGILTIIIGFLAAYIAYKQWKTSKEQEKINIQQKELQRCSFIYESFLKTKQEKLLELRDLYLDFYENCLALISLVYPSSIGSHDSTRPAVFSYEKNDSIISYGFDLNISYSSIFQSGRNSCKNLSKFLRINVPFLKEHVDLIEDLKRIIPVFDNLFQKIISNEQLKISLMAIAKVMDNNKEPVCLSLDMSKIRQLFYAELKGMILERNGSNTHLFFLISNNYFSKSKTTYEEKDIQKWSESNLIAFETHYAIVTFFDYWLSQIDKLFDFVYQDIASVAKNQHSE